MGLSQRDGQILNKLSIEVDNYFNAPHSNKIARSTDIFIFIHTRPLLRGVFLTSWDFGRFLKRMYDAGYLKAFITNCEVDPYDKKSYQWYFYSKTTRLSNEVNAESKISPPGYRKEGRNILTNNGDKVRSQQEAHIYNRLLQEKQLTIAYESEVRVNGEWKLTDFTIRDKLTSTTYVWEHFGMIENPYYADKTKDKIQWYLGKGYKFIQDGGTLIVTYYMNDHDFQHEVERMINLIIKRRNE